MFPATLFDYNGVLANDESLHLAAFREVLESLQISVSDTEYVERYLGFDDAGAFRQILIDSGRSPTELEISALIAAKGPIYQGKVASGLPTFAGAREFVERRAQAGPVAVVSGALREEIQLGLRALGLRDMVLHIVAAEDTAHSKPHPEGYHLALVALRPQLGPLVQRSLVIEDSLAGVQAAKALGLPCVALTHSYPEIELYRSGADLVVSTFSELTDPKLIGLYQRLYE